jgi:hypothetical protein
MDRGMTNGISTNGSVDRLKLKTIRTVCGLQVKNLGEKRVIQNDELNCFEGNE